MFGVLSNKDNLPEVREPFNQLCCVVLVELNVRKVHLENRWARVSHPEEHQLRLAQVHRCQCWRVQGSQGFTKFARFVLIIYIYMCVRSKPFSTSSSSPFSWGNEEFPCSCWGRANVGEGESMSNVALLLLHFRVCGKKAAINANNERLRGLSLCRCRCLCHLALTDWKQNCEIEKNQAIAYNDS